MVVPQIDPHAPLTPWTRAESVAVVRAEYARAYRLPVLGKQGETNVNARLIESDVRDIRARLRQGETMAAIASDYRVSVSNIWRIKHRLNWAHVDDGGAG